MCRLDLSESKKTLTHTELHHQFLPAHEIDTRPPTRGPKGSLHTFLVKDFQRIGECSIKENGLEHSPGHLCPKHKHTHTGAFQKGQRFYMETIKRHIWIFGNGNAVIMNEKGRSVRQWNSMKR